jgi:hypothetical protein
MAKKLKVQLEVDSSKARSQVERDMSRIDIGGGSKSAASASSADKLSKSLDQAAKKSNDFAGSAELLSSKTRQIVGAFAGMGVSMVLNSAAQTMKRGAGKTAVEAGAGALQGAITGGMAGGVGGAIIGGAIGAGSALFKTSQEKSRYKEDWQKSERDYASDKEFAKLVKSLSKASETTEDFAAKMKTVEEELAKYKAAERVRVAAINEYISSGKLDDADTVRTNLERARGRQETLETIKASLVDPKSKKEEKPEDRISHTAVDALARIGGNFAGGENGFRDLQRVNEKQVAILEKIEQKTGNNKGTF